MASVKQRVETLKGWLNFMEARKPKKMKVKKYRNKK